MPVEELETTEPTEDCSLLPRDDFIMSKILFLVLDGVFDVFDFLRPAGLLLMPSDLSWLAEF